MVLYNIIEMINNLQSFYVNSKRRESGTNENFTYLFNIIEPVNKVSIDYITIPKSYYMIADTYNYFYLYENGQQIKITIPAGNYTIDQFLTYLSSIMTSASLNTITYLCSKNQSLYDDGKIKISATNLLITKYLNFIDENAMNEIMGFNKGNTNNFTLSIICDNVINLSRENTIYLISDCVQNNYNDQYIGGNNILDVVYTSDNSPLFSYIVAQYDIIANMKDFDNTKKQIINFRLLDENNNEINLNGVDFSFTINFFEYIDNKSFYNKIKSYIDFSLINQK